MPSSHSRRRPSSFCTPTTSTLCNGGPAKEASFQRSISEVFTQPPRTSKANPRRIRPAGWRPYDEASMARLSWWQNALDSIDRAARLNVPGFDAHRPATPLCQPDRLRRGMVDRGQVAADFGALARGRGPPLWRATLRALAARDVLVSARPHEPAAPDRQHVRAVHVRAG